MRLFLQIIIYYKKIWKKSELFIANVMCVHSSFVIAGPKKFFLSLYYYFYQNYFIFLGDSSSSFCIYQDFGYFDDKKRSMNIKCVVLAIISTIFLPKDIIEKLIWTYCNRQDKERNRSTICKHPHFKQGLEMQILMQQLSEIRR